MKIAYLLEGGEEIRWPPYNGPANHVRQIVKELLARGHVVRLLVRLDGKIWRSDNLAQFVAVEEVPLDDGWQRIAEKAVRRTQSLSGLPYWGYFESLRFAQTCQRELAGYEIFLERFSWMMYGGLLAARRMHLPWIAEYNGNPLADLDAKQAAPQGLQRKISVGLTHWVLNQAEHVIASGDGWRTSCMTDWGIPEEKISVIENGTDLLQHLDRKMLRAFQAIDLNRPVNIVYLGGFYPWHGIPILLQAIYTAREQGYPLNLVLIGAGNGMEDAQRIVQELGLKEVVEFTGSLTTEEYAPYLANADIGVSPYCGWQEFSGLKLFDYKAAGLACIASGEKGQPRTLLHGKTGWIVPPCDVDELTRALIHLSSDFELRRSLGRSARDEAEIYNSWSCTTEKVEALLTDLIKRRRKG